jgi:hypothetical protein
MPWTCAGKRCGPCGRLHDTEREAKQRCRQENLRWRQYGHAGFDRQPIEITQAEAKRRHLLYRKPRSRRIV